MGNPMYIGADDADGLYDEVDVVGTGGSGGYMDVAPGQQQDDSDESSDEDQEDIYKDPCCYTEVDTYEPDIDVILDKYETVGWTHVAQLFNAMDKQNATNKSDGFVTKFEFLDFLKDHKPKSGPWSSVAKLQLALGLAKHDKIDLAAFNAAFAKAEAEGLKPESFEYNFA